MYNRDTGLHLAVIYNALFTVCTVSALAPLSLVLAGTAVTAFSAPAPTSLVLTEAAAATVFPPTP